MMLALATSVYYLSPRKRADQVREAVGGKALSRGNRLPSSCRVWKAGDHCCTLPQACPTCVTHTVRSKADDIWSFGSGWTGLACVGVAKLHRICNT